MEAGVCPSNPPFRQHFRDVNQNLPTSGVISRLDVEKKLCCCQRSLFGEFLELPDNHGCEIGASILDASTLGILDEVPDQIYQPGTQPFMMVLGNIIFK